MNYKKCNNFKSIKRTLFSTVVNRALPYLQGESLEMKLTLQQGTNARKVNCGRVYSAYILKPVNRGG